MTRYADLYWTFLIQRLKVLMEYRANFLIGVASTLFLQLSGILTIWVVMRQVPSLNGWSFEEVLLIYGLVTVAKSINHMFADNLWTIGRVYIRSGGFDRFLVRPIDPLFHLLADRFCQDGLGNFLIGLLLVIVAGTPLGIFASAIKIIYLVIAVLSGGLIFIALNLITCVSSFWILDSVPVTRAVFDNHLFAQYPLTIYPKAIGIVLTWLIPYGFASFYPATYLLGRDASLVVWLGPVVAIVLLVIGYRFWRFGLKHYAGTGS
jgi:ABC-2 type transport system permease protein